MRNSIKKSFHRESGFTLIELLIVIVIIGILAGVLIAVINPVRQQNRARNASVRAAILKAAFAVNTVRAGIGRLPTSSELNTELENLTTIGPFATNCASTNTDYLNCSFSLSGTTLPRRCAGDSVAPSNAGGEQCYLHVVSTGSNTNTNLIAGKFRIAAAAFDIDPANPVNHVYIFDSSRGLLECGGQVTYNTDAEISMSSDGTIGDSNCIVVSE